jgi:hypothetical protein
MKRSFKNKKYYNTPLIYKTIYKDKRKRFFQLAVRFMDLWWVPVKWRDVFVGWIDRMTLTRVVLDTTFIRMTKFQFRRQCKGGANYAYPQWVAKDFGRNILNLLDLNDYWTLSWILIANGGYWDFNNLYLQYRFYKKTHPSQWTVENEYEGMTAEQIILMQCINLWDNECSILNSNVLLTSVDDHGNFTAENEYLDRNQSIRYIDGWSIKRQKYYDLDFSSCWGALDKSDIKNNIPFAVQVAASLPVAHSNPEKFYLTHIKKPYTQIRSDRFLDQANLVNEHVVFQNTLNRTNAIVSSKNDFNSKMLGKYISKSNSPTKVN